ncbi:MAG: energy transducer TonB [Bacteroidales bacterium]|nr:energy transducer TonB [Bacteroidales bacterium]
MEIKKSKNANLEKGRSTNLLIGLLLSLAFVWMSFEYKTYDHDSAMEEIAHMDFEEEDLIIQTKAPEPIKPPPVKIFTKLIEVDDDVIVPDIDIDVETDGDDDIEDPVIYDDEIDDDDEGNIFVFVEDHPAYPGGDIARIKYLKKSVNYPMMAIESLIQGTVYVTFVVEKDGRITDVKVISGIGGGCDEEAVRVIKKMPKWNPGKQRGIPVRVQINVPIKFKLSS